MQFATLAVHKAGGTSFNRRVATGKAAVENRIFCSGVGWISTMPSYSGDKMDGEYSSTTMVPENGKSVVGGVDGPQV